MGNFVFSIMFLFATMLVSVAEAKFSRGDQFQYATIEGTLTAKCGSTVKTLSCRDIFLDPWPYDNFMGPRNGAAQNVELYVTVNKETQTAVVEYNGNMGRSANVNLGVYSLFQKPLLRLGENKVRYVLLDKNNKVLETDTFSVSVTRGTPRTCQPKVTTTPADEDCDHVYSLCQSYFRSQNYCR